MNLDLKEIQRLQGREIPAIKKLYQSYRDKGLHVISISIDEEKEKWVKALSDEKMAWPQHLVAIQDIEEVKQRFNFGPIPFVVFTDGNGKEIQQFTGYEKGREKEYEKVIQSYATIY